MLSLLIIFVAGLIMGLILGWLARTYLWRPKIRMHWHVPQKVPSRLYQVPNPWRRRRKGG